MKQENINPKAGSMRITNVRFSPDDKALVQQAAKKSGLKISAFIRMAAVTHAGQMVQAAQNPENQSTGM